MLSQIQILPSVQEANSHTVKVLFNSCLHRDRCRVMNPQSWHTFSMLVTRFHKLQTLKDHNLQYIQQSKTTFIGVMVLHEKHLEK